MCACIHITDCIYTPPTLSGCRTRVATPPPPPPPLTYDTERYTRQSYCVATVRPSERPLTFNERCPRYRGRFDLEDSLISARYNNRQFVNRLVNLRNGGGSGSTSPSSPSIDPPPGAGHPVQRSDLRGDPPPGPCRWQSVSPCSLSSRRSAGVGSTPIGNFTGDPPRIIGRFRANMSTRGPYTSLVFLFFFFFTANAFQFVELD